MAVLPKPVAHFLSQYDSRKHLYFMQSMAPPYFVLPVCAWLSNHFLVSGIGIEDQQNGLQGVPFSLHIIYIYGVDELKQQI
jgi:hypothetical protein